MFKILILLLMLLPSVVVYAQEISRKTLIYDDTLGLDLFIPDNGVAYKPLLIYVHGGGFSGGTRDYPPHLDFCQRYAKKGWVTATISYHLTMKDKGGFGCSQPSQNKVRTFLQAAQNVHQAVAFLIADSDEYEINPDQVVLVGSSAGAEAVLHAIYWKKTMENILPDTFQYAGVVSMAGAIMDIGWVQESTAIPSAFFHGTCDGLVPYANAPHHYCEPEQKGYLMLYGSKVIADRLRELNKPYLLVTDCGGGHEWSSKPIQEGYIELIDHFLEKNILHGRERQSVIVLKEGTKSCQREVSFCN